MENKISHDGRGNINIANLNMCTVNRMTVKYFNSSCVTIKSN